MQEISMAQHVMMAPGDLILEVEDQIRRRGMAVHVLQQDGEGTKSRRSSADLTSSIPSHSPAVSTPEVSEYLNRAFNLNVGSYDEGPLPEGPPIFLSLKGSILNEANLLPSAIRKMASVRSTYEKALKKSNLKVFEYPQTVRTQDELLNEIKHSERGASSTRRRQKRVDLVTNDPSYVQEAAAYYSAPTTDPTWKATLRRIHAQGTIVGGAYDQEISPKPPFEAFLDFLDSRG
ncbi:VP6 [St Croix River virus]|uniref:VP6 n=1 Tax=St Croix River virus TaxID=104581 RepID=Q9DSP1_9REOV|nr:VP6 [St Croix River virus]AAG34265.1 VP6 [St Croix River virus]